jgi:transposase
MTNGYSTRKSFFSRIYDYHIPLHVACAEASISLSTGSKWLKMQRITGAIPRASGTRRSIPGVIPYVHQDIMVAIVSDHPTFHREEIGAKLFAVTGYYYSPRQVRQCMSRKGFTHKLVSHHAPIERDIEFRRLWREQIIHPYSMLRAEHLVWVDETNKRRGDCTRNRGFCMRGDTMNVPIRSRNMGLSASIIASMSIEGIQCCQAIDIDLLGN